MRSNGRGLIVQVRALLKGLCWSGSLLLESISGGHGWHWEVSSLRRSGGLCSPKTKGWLQWIVQVQALLKQRHWSGLLLFEINFWGNGWSWEVSSIKNLEDGVCPKKMTKIVVLVLWKQLALFSMIFLWDLLCQQSPGSTKWLITPPCMLRNHQQQPEVEESPEGHSNPCPQPVSWNLELTCSRSRHSGSLCLIVMLSYNMIFCTNAAITIMWWIPLCQSQGST
jgi:hypothetical protein